ncbi:MAG: S8 family serine peptidase [Flavobacteriales bacterium]
MTSSLRPILLLFLIGFSGLSIQGQNEKYWVRFTDKLNTPYSIQNPEAFLSKAAIERRKKHGIEINRKDLPVDPLYKDSILAHPAVDLLHDSKWFNAISVQCSDSLHMDTLDALSFVAGTRKVRALTIPRPFQPKMATSPFSGNRGQEKGSWHPHKLSPGKARRQLSMMGLDHLLELGHRGKGIRIAVLDAGFPNVDKMDAFEHLFREARYVGGYDLVEGDAYPFRGNTHGRSVLSILAAKKKGHILGAAPEASYILCRTENGAYEYRIEEHNWVAAAEFADSAGADILSSSLAYTTFDQSSQDHSPSDLDGATTMITRGADLAASRGILVINSAGNYAQTSWGTLGPPADGDSVIAVGSVDSSRNWSSFSSQGPAADGRIKPDLAAMGEGTAFLGGDAKVYRGNGTSFSAPLISGAAACLWSAHPHLKPMELAELLQANAHQHDTPNNRVGHGIPNVYKAYLEEKGIRMAQKGDSRILQVAPNPFKDRLELHLFANGSKKLHLTWYDALGRKLSSTSHPIDPDHHHEIGISPPSERTGLFFIRVRLKNGPVRTFRVLHQKAP